MRELWEEWSPEERARVGVERGMSAAAGETRAWRSGDVCNTVMGERAGEESAGCLFGLGRLWWR